MPLTFARKLEILERSSVSSTQLLRELSTAQWNREALPVELCQYQTERYMEQLSGARVEDPGRVSAEARRRLASSLLAETTLDSNKYSLTADRTSTPNHEFLNITLIRHQNNKVEFKEVLRASLLKEPGQADSEFKANGLESEQLQAVLEFVDRVIHPLEASKSS